MAAPDRRWVAFGLLCAGTLMIVLDTTVVNVALPSIQAQLGFGDASLAWVVNAYLITFGGFLLLSGRLGDLFGHRRLFLAGLAVFTLASLACGLARSQMVLIAARAVQGLGGAVVSAVSFALIMDLFREPAERAKAMGLFGFIAAGGGSLGAVVGGFLTSFDWHWNFLVNIPIGLAVFLASRVILPRPTARGHGPRIDVLGASTITLALLLAVYAVVNGNAVGWASITTLGLLGVAAALVAVFVAIEARVRDPLVPLALFRLRNVTTSNAIAVLWAGAMFAWFFLSALYLRLVLGYSPLEIGLSFVPANAIMMAFSLGLSARTVMRFGFRGPLAVGLALAAVGLLLFARAPVGGSFLLDVLPAMVVLGVGAGLAFNPMLLAAMSDVGPDDSGLASGLVNTSFMLGGALGLAVLASVAASRTAAQGAQTVATLTSGYHAAFLVGGLFGLAAAGLAFGFLRARPVPPDLPPAIEMIP